jgi:hypothetical protein
MYVCMYVNIYIYIYIYTGCPRKKEPNFGRVFLRSNYTDITQNRERERQRERVVV